MTKWTINLYWCPLFDKSADGDWKYGEILDDNQERYVAYLRGDKIGAFGTAIEAAEELNRRDGKIPADPNSPPWNVRSVAKEIGQGT